MRPAPSPGVTWDNYRQLWVGMPAKDVDELLGEPHEVHELPTCTHWSWCGEEVEVHLTFEGDRLSGGVAFNAARSRVEFCLSTETILDRIRQWLHL
jgi:hypothetical protein